MKYSLKKKHLRTGITAVFFLVALPASPADTPHSPPAPESGKTTLLTQVGAGHYTCIKAADLKASPHFNSSLTTAFTLMANQPITGTAIAAALEKKENNITLCNDSRLPLASWTNSVNAVYRNGKRLIEVPPETRLRPAWAIHEAFHAWQDINGMFFAHIRYAPLLPEDRALMFLFSEATAFTYTQALLYEAHLNAPQSVPPFGGEWNQGLNQLFEKTFKAYNAAHPEIEPATRRKGALQAASHQVMRELLHGRVVSWRQAYIDRISSIAYTRLDGIREDKRGILRQYLLLTGRVVDGFHLVPPEFTGPDADAALSKVAKAYRFKHRPLPATEPLPWTPS